LLESPVCACCKNEKNKTCVSRKWRNHLHLKHNLTCKSRIRRIWIIENGAMRYQVFQGWSRLSWISYPVNSRSRKSEPTCGYPLLRIIMETNVNVHKGIKFLWKERAPAALTSNDGALPLPFNLGILILNFWARDARVQAQMTFFHDRRMKSPGRISREIKNMWNFFLRFRAFVRSRAMLFFRYTHIYFFLILFYICPYYQIIA
jgi:hypothetical protein